LFCGSQKYGIINLEKDFLLTDTKSKIIPEDKEGYKDLKYFYIKELGSFFTKENKITKLVPMNESYFILNNKNQLFGWGWNEHGNLGTGDLEDKEEVIEIAENVERIYGNGAYTIIKHKN